MSEVLEGVLMPRVEAEQRWRFGRRTLTVISVLEMEYEDEEGYTYTDHFALLEDDVTGISTHIPLADFERGIERWDAKLVTT